jgi:Rrf2 family protein
VLKMMISTKGRYALRVMIDLASQDSPSYIPLKEITERQNISTKYLESILSTLVKANLVIGIRGKGGGYRLTKHPSEYTLGSILKLTEGCLAPVSCLQPQNPPCERRKECPTRPIWERLDHMIDNFFEGITLEELLKQNKPGSYGNCVL